MIYRKKNKDIPYDKLRLHSSERNENFSDKLFNEFIKNIVQEDIKYYPNLEQIYKKLKIHYNTDNIIIGLGSDRCIEYFYQVNQGKELLLVNPSYPMYEVYGKIYKNNIKFVEYDNLKFPINEYLKNINKNTICVFSNPSSPIGDIINRNDIITILNTGVPVLVDEAYIEFSLENSIMDLIHQYSNLYITRTFSKAYGSAGIRLGIIASQKDNIDRMFSYRPVFEITNLTAKWASLLVDNFHEVETYIMNVKNVKNEVVNLLKNLSYEVIDGNCNWIHVKNLKNLPENAIFKEKCKIPNDNGDWVRLQITSNINDFNWLKLL